jgi:hypothetical protein
MGRIRNSAERGDGRNEYEAAIVTLEQVVDCSSRAVECRSEIGGDQPVPGFTIHFAERGTLRDSGADDEDLNRPIRRSRKLECRADALMIGDVALDCSPAERLGNRLERLEAATKE